MKVTYEQIISKIKSESYLVLPDGRTTLCTLILDNGYSVHGYSACVDATEFDINQGRVYACNDAIRQIWPLEGYLLAQNIFEGKINPVTIVKPEEQQWNAAISGNRIVASVRKKRTVRKTTDSAPWGYKKDGTPKKRPGRPAA
jgi:hypothetical protein